MSFIEKLKVEPEIIQNKNQLKRLFLKAPEFLQSSSKVSDMMKAYDLGIIPWLQSSHQKNNVELAKMCNDLKNAGIKEENTQYVIKLWEDILSEVYKENIPDKKNGEIESDNSNGRAVKQAGPNRNLMEAEEYVSDEVSYLNPTVNTDETRIYIPCGFGKTDHGFYICGITKEKFCRHKYADIFALVYNFFIRSTLITEEDYPEIFKDRPCEYERDYKSIYRMTIIILQLIRHNQIQSDLVPIAYEDGTILDDAICLINYYAALFCKLIKITPFKLRRGSAQKGICVVLDSTKKTGVHIENNLGLHSPSREIWYGHKLHYQLSQQDLPNVEMLLHNISPFKKFKEGQYEALCSMLNTRDHCVCIMPTGSGKSLLYYMASLMQPLPIFIVTPTDILIQDQIRNLKLFHHIDNVSHLLMTTENSFKDFEIPASLNYLTPTTLQSRNLIVKFRYINNGTKLIGLQEERIAVGPCAAYVVLDEIHCLSNWGHDFRPEYLMLSQYLKRYLDRVTFWGFTATANYTVVEDVQRQLDIPQNNFFSPVAFEKYNISYHFYETENTEEMYLYLHRITQSLIERNERTIVFTKSDEISRKAVEVIGYEADIFSHDNPYAYHHFVDGKCKILVASEELGIGINFPNIKNVIHFGLPLSKNEYVQEVGRAGRANEHARSYVIFLRNTVENLPASLLKRDTDINEIPELLKGIHNDYADIYKKITNDCPTKDELYRQLLALYHEYDYQKRAAYMQSCSLHESQKTRQLLFMLYTIGYINDWYAYEYNQQEDAVDILIDICSTDTESYRNNPQVMFFRMQKRLSNYFEFLGNNREAVAKTNRATSPEELIQIFVDWYYVKYLYHQNEQFLDLYEFIHNNMKGDKDRITKEIKDYFVLPFIKLKTDEAYYLQLTTEEIIEKALEGIGSETLANLERINTNRYSVNIDLMLFCGNYRMENRFEDGRATRVLNNSTAERKQKILAALPKLYGAGKTAAKLEMLQFIGKMSNNQEKSMQQFLDAAYMKCDKDLIYFAYMAKYVNRHFGKMGV